MKPFIGPFVCLIAEMLSRGTAYAQFVDAPPVVVTEYACRQNGRQIKVVSIMEFQDGMVAREAEYHAVRSSAAKAGEQ